MGHRELITKQILAEYDLKIDNVEKLGKVWKVYTDRGIKCLMAFEGNEERLKFIFEGLEHIAKRGFRNAIRFIRTKHGQPYILHSKNKIFYLSDWFEGRNCNFTNEEDILLAADYLGKLHLAAEGFRPIINETEIDPELDVWNDWIGRLESRINELGQYKDIAGKKAHKSKFDKNFLKYVDYYITQSIQALKLLKDSKYPTYKTEEASKGFICHRSYSETNLIISQDNSINIVDFDNCIQDIKIYDLTRFLEVVLIRNRWSWELARGALRNYGQIINLTDDDLKIALSLLCFPRRFWVVAKRYYRDNKDWDQKTLIKSLKLVIKEEKLREEFLSRFFSFYRRYTEARK